MRWINVSQRFQTVICLLFGLKVALKCFSQFKRMQRPAQKNLPQYITTNHNYLLKTRDRQCFTLSLVSGMPRYMQSLMAFVTTGENNRKMTFSERNAAIDDIPEPDKDEASDCSDSNPGLRVEMFTISLWDGRMLCLRQSARCFLFCGLLKDRQIAVMHLDVERKKQP